MALKSSRDRDRGGKRSGGSSFKYQERDKESIRKRAEQQGGKFDSILKSGFDSWRPADGENAIRILPPTWEDHDHYGYDIWVHSFVGPDKSTYLCPAKMLNKACPICKAAREATAAGETDDAKQLSATRRVAVWVLDRNGDKTTPALWTMSWSMDRDIAALCQNKRTGKVLLIDHPQHGYDVLFNKTGKALNTRYVGMAVDREETPALEDEDELDAVLEYIQENPIPDVLNFYDEKYLTNMIEGTTETDDEELADDDEDDRGGSKRDHGGKSGRKPSRRDEDEDVEDEDAEEDAEEDRSERRSSSRDRDRGGKSSRKPARRDEEEDEEEEDDDDAVEERAAARNKGKGRRDEDEDEEEDAEEDAPRGRDKSNRKSARRDEDEEEDLEDEEDEDAEERPRKSSGRDRQPSRRR